MVKNLVFFFQFFLSCPLLNPHKYYLFEKSQMVLEKKKNRKWSVSHLTSVALNSLTLGLCGGSSGARDTVTSNFSASLMSSLYFLSASLSASCRGSLSRTGGADGAWLRRRMRGGVAPGNRADNSNYVWFFSNDEERLTKIKKSISMA